MKKVININFQGQVIAIEETAYEILKQYIESLQRYFSKEDGGGEIVNDIENRIAELFGNRLKLGINCITDEDVESIIANIGRPEEFDTEYDESTALDSTYASENEDPLGAKAKNIDAGASKSSDEGSNERRGESLNRNSNDKIIGGVCSGLANYFKTDPTWIRLIFLFFFGVLFWVYIVLWIVLRAKPMESNVAKRLYRNPNDKYIGGVCGGIAAYFKIDSWIPRVLFLLPLIFNLIGIFSFFPLNHFFKDIDFSWNLNGGVVLIYIVLMIIIPEAKSVKQKLEMMGEEEYIKTIRDKVSDAKSSYATHAKTDDLKSSNAKSTYSNLDEMPPVPPTSNLKTNVSAKSERSGCLNVFVILIKVLFFSFVGVFALAMVAVLIGLLVAGAQFVPLKSLFIDSGYETNLLILALGFLILTPIISIVVWIIRRAIKAKSRPLIGVFSIVLWVVGVVLAIILATKVADKFKVESSNEKTLVVAPVSSDKLYIEMNPYKEDYAEYRIGIGRGSDIDGLPYTNINEDSLLFINMYLQIRQSRDSLFHIRTISATYGENLRVAKSDLNEFTYNVIQKDSLILLPEFLTVPVEQGFRNQSITVEISVPAGKSIEVSDALDAYKNNRPPTVVRKRIRSYDSSYTPYEYSSL